MLTAEHPYPSNYGVVSVSGGMVKGISEKPALAESMTVSTGCFSLTPDIFDYPATCMIPDIITNMAKNGRPIRAVPANRWHDAIYAWDLLKMNVLKRGANGAIVHDGDADRFMGFDEKGRYISGDHLMMLFAEFLGAKHVVTTVDASMAIEETAEVRRTPVGDSYVSEELLSWGDFGGEASGAWIFPEMSLCPDGIYAAGLFCSIASEHKISELVDKMPSYPILRSSYPCGNAKEVLTAMGAENPTDGLRITEDDGWCLIRASGTEPKVRITAEGKTTASAEKMREKGLTMLKAAGKTLSRG